ncbi:MAG: hypothetical protein ACP5J5_03530 [Dissulfurimicrobium sp.]|uniref:hypothetical protein n=1 Tax=Dissulfurimicrobium TaxID=1769732 RepID=UPI001ED9D52D|nr:hypothetical protein [Dissulfurimicrobium hydrothermale]UKL14213.1 hypothetical protein LGS26_02895 [Dissulfurimicrobium hydrothermale]
MPNFNKAGNMLRAFGAYIFTPHQLRINLKGFLWKIPKNRVKKFIDDLNFFMFSGGGNADIYLGRDIDNRRKEEGGIRSG